GLSGPGLTHQAEDLTTPHGDRHVADDLHVRGASDHGQSVGHQNGVVCFCHFSTPRSIPIEARERPSVMRLAPMVKIAIAVTGSATAHGWMDMPWRFSLIIRPQSAVGGCSPIPRK